MSRRSAKSFTLLVAAPRSVKLRLLKGLPKDTLGCMTASHWTAADLPDLHGRTAIVTGANSGIGRVAALELARAGAAVTLAVRNTAKGDAAAAAMTGDVTVRGLDLADLGSVRSFAEGTEGPLDILVDNAGIMATPEARTVDGFELQIGTNHLGHFALTNLLLPHITDRVIVVSSDLHRNGKIDLDDLNWEHRSYKPWAAYSQSKLANLLFVLELERRLTEPDRRSGPSPRTPGTPPPTCRAAAATRSPTSLGPSVTGSSHRATPRVRCRRSSPPRRTYAGGTYIGPERDPAPAGVPRRQCPGAREPSTPTTARRLWDLSEQLTGVSWPLSPLPRPEPGAAHPAFQMTLNPPSTARVWPVM